MLELIWLKSEVVTVAAIFHWPILDSHRHMNHKQSHVVKMIEAFFAECNLVLSRFSLPSGLYALAKYVAK